MGFLFRINTLKQYGRAALSKTFFLGKKVRFRRFFLTSGTGEIIIGNDVFFNNNVSLNSLERIEIGDNVLIGEDVKIYDHDHKFGGAPFEIKKHEFNTESVLIGNNVWIGTGTIILKGTVIGNNVVIGAGCIISGTIPDNSKVIQKRETTIVGLEKYK